MRSPMYPHVHTHQKSKPWYERDGGHRLARDREHIASMYPGLTYYINGNSGEVALEGALTLLADCGIPSHVQVRLVFPDNYPAQEPRVYDAASRFPHTADRHFYPNGQCCLWLPPESRWAAHDPDNICRFLEEVAVFFDRQLVYDADGKGIWPGGQRSHGGYGYLEFIQEALGGDQRLLRVFASLLLKKVHVQRNEQCPCGSGRKYKRCHLDRVEDIRRRVGEDILREIINRHFIPDT